jgi:hypothetical protein
MRCAALFYRRYFHRKRASADETAHADDDGDGDDGEPEPEAKPKKKKKKKEKVGAHLSAPLRCVCFLLPFC